MKVLLDELLPHKLREAIHGHDVWTASYAGFTGLQNGTLIRTAEGAGFEVFVTGDKGIAHQQNLQEVRIAVVELSATHWNLVASHLDVIQAAIDNAAPRSFVRVECGRFTRKRRRGSGW